MKKRSPVKMTALTTATVYQEETPFARPNKSNNLLLWIRNLLLKICLVFFAGSFLVVFIFKWVPLPFSSLMIQRKIEALWDGKPNATIHYDWVSYEEISGNMKIAAVASEDQLFSEHFGVDWDAVEKAFIHNEKSRRVKGGSTISQQVSKNVFLWPSRSFVRKGVELYFTFLIELLWGKERILEVYLNIVELGDRIFGVEAASQIHFNRSARKLSREQSALLAVVLPNPIRYSVRHPSPYVRARQQWVLKQMNSLGGSQYLKKL